MIAWQATVQDDEGNVIVNPSITVRRASDDGLADIFDAAGDPLANPFIGSSEGFCQFFAHPGEYRVQGARGGSVTQTWAVTLSPDVGKQYATRAAFVDAVNDGYAPADGTVVSAGGVQYVRDVIATAISDLPGWLPGGGGTVYHFGAVGDGVADDTAAVTAYIAWVNTRTGPAHYFGEGRFRMVGSAEITLTRSLDFTGSTLVCAEWTGGLILGRTTTPVTYGPGTPIVNAFEGSSDLTAASCVIDGWRGQTDVEDCLLHINADMPLYNYRSLKMNYFLPVRVYNEGVLSNNLLQDLTGVPLTSLTVFPNEPAAWNVRGLTFDVSADTSPKFPLTIRTSRLTFDAHFNNDSEIQNENPTLFLVTDSNDVRGRVSSRQPMRSSATTGFTYLFNCGHSAGIDLEVTSDGDGWGASANRDTSCLTIRNSRLNRLDFHRPLYHRLDIIDCTMGNAAIKLVGFGDVTLTRVAFNRRGPSPEGGGNLGLIRGREDSGAFVDGNLSMRDCTVDIPSGISDQLFSARPSRGKPAGSPANYVWFRRMYIDGLHVRGGGTVTVNPAERTDGHDTQFCEHFSMSRATGVAFDLDLTDQEKSNTVGDFAITVNLDDCELSSFRTRGGVLANSIKLAARDIRGVQGTPLDVTILGHGSYDFDASVIGGIVFSQGGVALIDRTIVRLRGCDVTYIGTNLILGGAAFREVSYDHCAFHVSLVGYLHSTSGARHTGCRYYHNGSAHRFDVAPTASSSTYTLRGAVPQGQAVELLTGNLSDPLAVPFNMPADGGRVLLYGANSSDSPQPLILTRSGNNLNASGSATLGPILVV